MSLNPWCHLRKSYERDPHTEVRREESRYCYEKWHVFIGLYLKLRNERSWDLFFIYGIESLICWNSYLKILLAPICICLILEHSIQLTQPPNSTYNLLEPWVKPSPLKIHSLEATYIYPTSNSSTSGEKKSKIFYMNFKRIPGNH